MTRGSKGAEKKAILVVDDDIVLLKLADEILRDHYRVSLAKSASRALRLLDEGFTPDLVLLDIEMPELDGYQTLEKIQSMEHLQDVPVVFLTGLHDSVAELRGLEAGALDYITKPFSREVLLARIALRLESGSQRMRLKSLEAEGESIRIDEQKFAAFTQELNNTEKRVAKLIALGYSNQQICDQLHYSYSYVKKVNAVIFEKTGISKRHELRGHIT